jgi:hypothetical protein
VQKEIEEKQSVLVSMRKRKQFLSEEIPQRKESLLQLVESIVSKKVSFKD